MNTKAIGSRRILQNLLCFCAGAALASAIFFPLLQGEFVLSSNARRTLASSDSCRVLFVGSSLVEHQIRPKFVDAGGRAVGAELRSCKFGVKALKSYELRFWLERLMQNEWPALELVVIDVTLGDTPSMTKSNRFNQRVVEWHTLGSVPAIFAFYLRETGSLLSILPEIGSHMAQVFANRFSLGRGAARLGELEILARVRSDQQRNVPMKRSGKLQPRSAPGAATSGLEADGFEGQDLNTSASATRRMRTLKSLDEAGWDAMIAGRIQENDEASREGRYQPSDFLVRLREIVRAKGAEARFIHAPVLFHRGLPDRANRGPDPLVFLDFNDPTRYPQLFRRAVRKAELYHLNSKGSRIYSEIVGRELARDR